MPQRRSLEQRRSDRAAGVDRHGRTLPREAAAAFDPLEFRCARCGAAYTLPSTVPRLIMDGRGNVAVVHPRELWVVTRLATNVIREIPLEYRCSDELDCRERERSTVYKINRAGSRPRERTP